MRMPTVLPSLIFFIASIGPCCLNSLHAQEDGGVSVSDGGGGGILERIYVPNLPNAPFSLTLRTEWVQTMRNGGTFTEVNARPIMRDTAGRIYRVATPASATIRSLSSLFSRGGSRKSKIPEGPQV